MQSMWYGGAGSQHGIGHTSFSLAHSKEARRSFPLNPGTYWFGAQARGEDGLGFAQVGTGLVRIVEGDYRVTLKLRPKVSLTGVLRTEQPMANLAVALAMSDGALLPLDVSMDSMASIVDVGRLGDFRLENAPAGTFELRVGTRAELMAGKAQVTREIQLIPGEPMEVEIAW